MLFSLFKNKLGYIFLLQLLLLVSLSPSISASPFSQELKFENFSVKSGLSQSFVYSMAEDNEGFIWIATQDGLNRFDGKNFVTYTNSIGNPHSVSDNFIRKVFIDNKNILWVGTNNGLSRYNRKDDSFERFEYSADDPETISDNQIWDVFQDRNGDIWVSTASALHKYDTENNSFKKIRIRGFEAKLKEVKTIYQDKKGNYWFGTFEKGIFISNESLSYTYALKDGNNKNGLKLDVDSLFDVKYFKEYYWLATNLGVFKINSELSTFEKVVTPNSGNKTVRAITIYDDSHLWFATLDGLVIYNTYTNNVYRKTSSESLSSLSSNELISIIKSGNGLAFIGSYKGLSVFNPITTLFEHIPFKSGNDFSSIEQIIEMPDNTIWLSSEQLGLNVLTDNKLINVPVSFGHEINTLKKLNDNKILALTYNNDLFEVNTNELTSKFIGTVTVSNSYLTSHQLIVDDLEQLWFIDVNGNLFKQEFNDSSSIVNIDISHSKALFYGKGEVWVLTNENIYSIDSNSNQKKSFEISDVAKSQLEHFEKLIVGKRYLWLTSSSYGVLALDKTSKVAKAYNNENGLLNNSISSLVIDLKDSAWVTTTKGVSIINPDSKSVINYYSDYNLDNNEPMYSSALFSSNGLYYYGGINGLHKVDSERLQSIQPKLYEPFLSNLRVLNKNIEPTKSSKSPILKKQLNETKMFTLNHKDSPFSLNFTSPNPSIPSQLSYRYKLTGLDNEWIETDYTNTRATYTNLSAGLYTFEVEAFDKYHPEIRKSATVKINILPPWWLSSTAIFAYVLMIMAIVAYFIQQGRYKRQYNLQIKKSEERLKLSLWGSGDEMWDWNISTGKIYRSNIWGILEFPQDGRRNLGTEQTNIHPQDIPRVREALNEHFEDDSTHFEATYRVKGKNEKWMWILDRGKIVERDKSNEPTRMTGTLKDISHIKTAEERLKLFAKCIENISDAVIIYDRQFITVDVNKAYQKITGINRQSMLGKSMKFTRYSETFNQNVKKHLITKGSWHGEIESMRADKELYLTDLNIDVIRDENNNISHFVGVFSDITQRKKTEAELRKLANSDTLTGLPNRSYFQANQAKLVNNKIPHALLVFDLDNFKKINDSMGHEVGDVLLCKVADRMLNVGRKQDSVYRLGGDEFSLIIENTNDIHTITTIAKDILKTIAQPLKLKSQELVLYSSIGIVLFPEDGASPQELLKNADTAMYHAKDQGGNKYQFFSESMNKQAVKRLQIENLIRHGLKEDFFSVFFQPKIEISTGKISGMEALVRFETPTKGIISPGVFIPVSEETGQIIDIGEVVLRKSCVATKKWVEAGLFKGRIAVNLSAVQFTQPNLVKMISDILDETGLEAKYLELEITEGTVMDSPQEAIDTMLQIRAMGIHLSLDDFGTGYSSLAYLKKFPLNTLKIDKAFVDDIELSDQGRNMVATIVTIAHNLGMNVVAEGVETEPQLSFLAGLRCEQMQGYLYSKPLSEKDFQNYLVSYRITDKSTKFITP